MRAAVLEAPRRLRLVERARPAPGPGQALVRVLATAICHTDLEIYTGRHPGVRYPVVLGHEAAGEVEAVGPGVHRLRPGARVLVNPIVACGACDACARGRGNLCRRAGLLGRELEGSLAGHLVLAEDALHPLPPGLPPERAPLLETLATVHHAQRRAGVAPGDSVVVFGLGASGLLHAQLARRLGAAPVVGVSRTPGKLVLARRLGVEHVVDATRADPVAEVARLTGGRGADVAVDTTGEPAVLAQALAALAPGGRLVLYAISHRPLAEVTAFPVYFKELTLYGSRALTPEDVAPAVELVTSGAIDLEGFVTARYPLARVAAALEAYERDPGQVLRLVVLHDAE